MKKISIIIPLYNCEKYISNIERRTPYRKEPSDETLRKLNDKRRRRILKHQRKTI